MIADKLMWINKRCITFLKLPAYMVNANTGYWHTVDRRFIAARLESLIENLKIAVVMYAH